jgi:hypothetical protein
LRLRRRGPVAEGEEADVFHGVSRQLRPAFVDRSQLSILPRSPHSTDISIR